MFANVGRSIVAWSVRSVRSGMSINCLQSAKYNLAQDFENPLIITGIDLPVIFLQEVKLSVAIDLQYKDNSLIFLSSIFVSATPRNKSLLKFRAIVLKPFFIHILYFIHQLVSILSCNEKDNTAFQIVSINNQVVWRHSNHWPNFVLLYNISK